MSSEAGGINRLQYAMCLAGVIVIRLVGQALTGEGILGAVMALPVVLIATSFRLKNMGRNEMWALAALIPIVSLAVAIICLYTPPKGYIRRKSSGKSSRNKNSLSIKSTQLQGSLKYSAIVFLFLAILSLLFPFRIAKYQSTTGRSIERVIGPKFAFSDPTLKECSEALGFSDRQTLFSFSSEIDYGRTLLVFFVCALISSISFWLKQNQRDRNE